MRAILIDPTAKTLVEFDYKRGDSGIASVIGCDLFTVVNIGSTGQGGRECIFVDDEGLLKDGQDFFAIGDYELAGKGLVLGCDWEGETVATKVDIDRLRSAVRWMSADEPKPEPGFTVTVFGGQDE